MSANFLELDADSKRDLINEIYPELGIPAEAIEKDIWICYVLDILFSIPGCPSMVFRGGTSLSKAFNAIERFSEDIDITISHEEILPETETSQFLAMGGNKRKETLKTLSEKIVAMLQNKLAPLLAERLAPHGRLQFDEDEKMTLLFFYDSCLGDSANAYISRSIRLEFGGRNSTEPSEAILIQSYAATILPDFVFPKATVPVVSGSRTFWDKATLIHAAINRFAKGKAFREGKRDSRHWYDLYRLCGHGIGYTALTKDVYLLKEVVTHKKYFFSDNLSRYDDCLIGKIKLVPTGGMLYELEKDYRQMIDAGMLYAHILLSKKSQTAYVFWRTR